MHVNFLMPVFKPTGTLSSDFQKLLTHPKRLGTTGDRFESQRGAIRFQGKVTQNPYLKGVLSFALGLSSLLGPLGPSSLRAHEGHDHEMVPPPRELSTRNDVERIAIPVQPDVKRYTHIENLYKTMKAEPKGSWDRSQTEQRITNSWNALANDARNGDTPAKMAVQALWVNRMFEELTEPSDSLHRIDYPEYTELVNEMKTGELTQEQFKTELQWRALIGLYCFYRNGIADNQLVSSPECLYEPVSQLLAANHNPKIQAWGGSLLNNVFPQLNPEQQADYLATAGERYFKAPSGNSRLSALKAINWLNQDVGKHPFWVGFIPKVRTELDALLEDKEQVHSEDIKYHITTLGMLRDIGSSERIIKVLSPEFSLEAQGSAAWSLGRLKTEANLNKLIAVAHNPQFNVQVREHAIYSIAEYAGQYETRVWEELNTFKADSAKGEPENLREAARAMRDMLTDRYLTEPDYYINKLLKTDADKTAFRAIRNQYVTGMEQLNTGQKNMVDRALLPYRHFLPDVVAQGGKHYIISGVVTDMPTYKNSFGKRIHDGRLNDTIEGMSSATAGAVTNRNRISPAIDNTFAHEFMHHIHQLVMNNDQLAAKVLKKTGLNQQIVDLYRKAVQEKRVLDYYGATDEYENLAQGGEAMDAQYRKHSQLFNAFFNRGYDSGSDNSRSKLKRQDPALFKFLESIRSIPLEISLKYFQAKEPQLYAELLKHAARDIDTHVA